MSCLCHAVDYTVCLSVSERIFTYRIVSTIWYVKLWISYSHIISFTYWSVCVSARIIEIVHDRVRGTSMILVQEYWSRIINLHGCRADAKDWLVHHGYHRWLLWKAFLFLSTPVHTPPLFKVLTILTYLLIQHPSGYNFISARGNLPQIISKLLQRLIAAHEYFPTCSVSLK